MKFLLFNGKIILNNGKIVATDVEPTPQVYDDCLTFTGKTSDFTLKASDKAWDGTLEYSTDHNTWTALTGTEEMQSVGKKLYLRGKGNTTFYDSANGQGVIWVLSAKADCTGNIQTLLNWENPPTSVGENCFRGMFENCTNLTIAPELPATSLANYCYSYMFFGCTSLTTAPGLPAPTLTAGCYNGMFRGCSSLTTAPELPSINLADACYKEMFDNCKSLTTAPQLPATTLTISCYHYMFQDCTSLTTVPKLPATTLTTGCYSSMFRRCKNLTSAPELPATILAESCYSNMFKDCTKLKVNNTSGTTIFTCPSDIPDAAVSGMFSGTGGTFKNDPTAGDTYYYTL